MVPRQMNGWDCGLYAIHYGLCFGLQAQLTDITKERIDLYWKRLILYFLDGLQQRSILLSKPIWYEDFMVELPMFPA
jgi:Ulp1 family protease